jgi:PAS domain S-box-containing protein
MTELSLEHLCRAIVAGSHDAIIFADRQGIIRLWNGGAEAMFGYPAAEAIGRPLDLIIPENLRPRHWEGFHRVMETGVSRYATNLLAVPALCKDGRRISVEFSMALVRDEAGGIVGGAAVIRDVTSRWEKEKAIRERLAALEAESRG